MRQVHFRQVSTQPTIVLLEDFLAAEECDHLIQRAQQSLFASPVFHAGQSERMESARTSDQATVGFQSDAIVQNIEFRIQQLTHTPISHGEHLQVVRYLPGQQYKPHYDYFDPSIAGHDRILANAGQRTWTLIMYLNTPEAGGETSFPKVGIKAIPKKGRAVLFSNLTPEGDLDRLTLHGGDPVIAGEKWIATKWLRQQPYQVEAPSGATSIKGVAA